MAAGGTGGIGSGGAVSSHGGNGGGGSMINITVSGSTVGLYIGGSGGPALFGPR